MKLAGYATGCIGKWHLGFVSGMRPMEQGFDSYYGVLHNLDRFETIFFDQEGGMPILRGDVVEKRPAVPAEMTGLYTSEALQFIEANRDRPFFLYLAHAMPHIPFDASPRFKGKSARGLYGDAVEELDWSTGEILTRLHLRPVPELYDLMADVSESCNVAQEHPEVVQRLTAQAARLTTASKAKKLP